MAKMKKCIKIGLLSAILTTGIVVAVSCSSSDDDTQDNKYGTPYDRAIGNGNYILHNFASNNDNISRETAADDLNHYLGLAKTYLQNKLNAFDKSLNNRESAKQYFSDFIQELDNNTYYNFFNATGTNLDHAANEITLASEQYFEDIVKNLNNIDERYTFLDAYRMMVNEAYHEGLGSSRTATIYRNSYETEKNNIIRDASMDAMMAGIDLEAEFTTNNFQNITNLTDQLLTTAAGNISNRQGIDVHAEDLRQIVNFNLVANSLSGIHTITAALLNHKNNCVMSLRDEYAIQNGIDKARQEEQQQMYNQELGM